MSSTYPFAPLKPSQIPLRLSTTAARYGMELGFESGASPRSDHLADIVESLEKRVLQDAIRFELDQETAR